MKLHKLQLIYIFNFNVFNSGSLCAKYSLLDMLLRFFSVILKLDLHVYPMKAVHNSSGMQKENYILITMHFVGKHVLIY